MKKRLQENKVCQGAFLDFFGNNQASVTEVTDLPLYQMRPVPQTQHRVKATVLLLCPEGFQSVLRD